MLERINVTMTNLKHRFHRFVAKGLAASCYILGLFVLANLVGCSAPKELPPARDLIRPEQVREIFAIPEDVEIALDDQSDTFAQMVRYTWNHTLPPGVSNSFMKEGEAENQFVEITYLYPKFATYKTPKEAEAFLRGKLETEPDSYSALEGLGVTAAYEVLKLDLVWGSYIIDVGVSLRYDQESQHRFQRAVAEAILEGLGK